jgi:hypothetical protein
LVLNRLRKKSLATKDANWLKPLMILVGLRGAEAPLVHVAARIRELFRSL